jgi:hypothetical protein
MRWSVRLEDAGVNCKVARHYKAEACGGQLADGGRAVTAAERQ